MTSTEIPVIGADLVNNATLFATLRPRPFEEFSSDEFDRVLQVNVRGTFERIKGIATHDDRPADAIRANTLTRCLPRDRTPEDLTGVVGFLLSAENGFMTGRTVVVDGGRRCIEVHARDHAAP